MPNWCSNQVTFIGSKDSLNLLYDKIKLAEKDASLTGKGQKLHNYEKTHGYMFDLNLWTYEDDDNQITLSFESKWDNIILDIAAICVENNVKAEYYYNECSCDLYGNAFIDTDGTVIENTVPAVFFDLIDYDDEKDVYTYDNEEYSYKEDILDDEFRHWSDRQKDKFWEKRYNAFSHTYLNI